MILNEENLHIRRNFPWVYSIKVFFYGERRKESSLITSSYPTPAVRSLMAACDTLILQVTIAM